MIQNCARKVLVTGASIAGPALAYWLGRRGFEVTLVERAPTIRSGGYAIDLRGTALDVAERMGILPACRTAHVATRRVTFVTAGGRRIGALNPDDFGAGAQNRHVELPRGVLTALLVEGSRDLAAYRFNDSIAALDQEPDSVDVMFRSGASERFDLVISGEGLHSSTRALVFGPEERFSHYLGFGFAIAEIPNRWGLSHEAVIWNRPGKGAALYATSDGPTLFALFTYRRPPPKPEDVDDQAKQRVSLEHAFAGEGWRIPQMIADVREAKDVYFDVTMQIRMPVWSSGRVALAGDAAFAPSFFTGQGTSLALVGAYVLADALARTPEPAAGFASYEAVTRPYVTANQALLKDGSTLIAPGTAVQLLLRNVLVRSAPLLKGLRGLGPLSPPAYEALTLSKFEGDA